MLDPAMRRFVERLAAAAGVAAIPLIGAADAVETETACVVTMDRACPAPADALGKFVDDERWARAASCPVVAVLGEGEPAELGDECCYEVQVDCSLAEVPVIRGDTMGMGCMGRPFIEAGRVVSAEVTGRGSRWRGPLPDVTGLDPARRAVLARFWVGVALAEHASIAEFHRVCLELMRHGAPTELLARAQVAAVDEARHWRRCMAVASAYAGKPLDVGVLPIAATVELAPDLVALAATTARDGCVAETCSAWLYARLGERATDPAVRAVLAGVVRDETRHAELAWATLRWAIARGGAPVRAAALAAMAAPPPAPATEDVRDDALLAAHAWAPYSVQERITTEAWRRVVRPLAEQLAVGEASWA